MSRGLQQKSPNEWGAARPTPRMSGGSGSRRVCPSPSATSTVISRSPPGQSPLAKKKVIAVMPPVAHRAAQGSSLSSSRSPRAATEHVSSSSRKPSQELQQGPTGVMADAKQSHARDADAHLIAILKDKVLKFREILDLPSRNVCLTLHELLLGTLKDLEESYISSILVSDYDVESPNEVLFQFCKILNYVGELWNAKCVESEKISFKELDEGDLTREKLGGIILDRLDQMSSRMKEMFYLMGKVSPNSNSEIEAGLAKPNNCSIPLTPTSVLPEAFEHNSNVNEKANVTCMPQVLQPLGLQAIGNLKAMDGKHLSIHMFPLVLDHNPQPVHQMKSTADNFKAESVNAVMIMEPVSSANLRNDITCYRDKEDEQLFSFPISTSSSEFPIPQESPAVSVASSPIFVSCMSNPSATNAHQHLSTWQMQNPNVDSGEDSKHKPSEAAILVTPSLPLLRLRASLFSPTPTPPPSPMVLTGIPMFFHSPEYSTMEMEQVTYAMTINEDIVVNESKSSQTPIVPLPENQASSLLQPSKGPMAPAPPTSSAKYSMEPSSSTPLLATSALSPLPSTSPPPPPPPLKGNLSPLSSSPSSPLTPQSLSASSLTPPASPSAKGITPPPPPQSVAKTLRTKKANSKLKRSTQMGNLYRLLKGKVEGSSLSFKESQGQNNQIGSSSRSNKAQGMADALAEITRRSTYFRQIEEDVGKYAAVIREVKSALNSFETKDMVELLSFHRYVEQCLENLTDETQVLARFEGFPSKKLETVRMAASLYRKLNSIITTLKGWNLVSPIAQQLNKIENFFNKIKEEVDVIERTKDEESKRFQSHKIEFDFSLLIKIKESMVDLSSNCIEIALKESKEAKEMAEATKYKPNDLSKMLWRAFQMAFRVYNFAGGQDDRADRLTTELAHEIETCYQF